MSLLVQTLLVILAVVAASTYLLRRGWKFVRLFRVGGGGEGRGGCAGGCEAKSRPRKQKVRLEPTRKLER